MISPNSPLIKKLPVETLINAINAECEFYSELLSEQPVDIVCMGISLLTIPRWLILMTLIWLSWLSLRNVAGCSKFMMGVLPQLPMFRLMP
jgi:hypothetical protein